MRNQQSLQAAVLLGLVVSGLLWIIFIPHLNIYAPNGFDIPALADGALLAPDAHWQQWFTRGYADFWQIYPGWGELSSRTAFTRPAFQFLIYLAHFVFGKNWALYNVINCIAVAGVAALAFLIARTALALRTGLALLAALLAVLSPPVLLNWLEGFAFSIEAIATTLAAAAFLAAVNRRDGLCLIFLFLALLTKENAVWVPLAAAMTILLRPKADEPFAYRLLAAAVMLLPIAAWVALRFAYFGGFGGTYATHGYTPFANFLRLTFFKLTHLHHLFVTAYGVEGHWALNWAVGIAAALLVYALLFLWALSAVPKAVNSVRHAVRQKQSLTMDTTTLVTLWAVLALAFQFALPVLEERYATSVVVFGWPALIAEAEKRQNVLVWLGVAATCILSLIFSVILSVKLLGEKVQQYADYNAMHAVLQDAPPDTRQIYVLPASGLQAANPKYLRLALGVRAEIVRVADIDWRCDDDAKDVVAFDRSETDGVVSLAVTLPACANFRARFGAGELDGISLTDDHLLRRGDAMSYEMPEGYSIKPNPVWGPTINLGRKMTVRVRPDGRARFIIEHGKPGGIAWFDTP